MAEEMLAAYREDTEQKKKFQDMTLDQAAAQIRNLMKTEP